MAPVAVDRLSVTNFARACLRGLRVTSSSNAAIRLALILDEPYGTGSLLASALLLFCVPTHRIGGGVAFSSRAERLGR